MMAENAPTSVDAVVDPCEWAVERFLKWETDGAKRQLAQDGALPRVLNEDVVEVLGDGQFEWLKSRAFVVRDGQQWRYHSVVRDQMLRYQWQKSPKRWTTTHGKLAAYYDKVRQGLGLEAGKEAKDERWRELSLEWLYHELCAAPQAKVGMALNGFLRALKQSSGFAREWAVAMAQAGQEASCETVRQWGERLRDGMVAQKEKRYEESISALTALLGEFAIEEKLKAVALNWRGSWYRRSEQTELALKDFQQAVEIDGEDPEYWFDLALTYQNLNRYEEASTAYRRAIELVPKHAYPYNNLGILYKEQKQYEEAIAAYQRAIELDPRFAYPHYNLGSLYSDQKHYEEAIAAYQRAIELDPKYASPHNGLGILYSDQKHYEEAIAAYRRAIDLDPSYKWAFANRGKTYCLMERYEEALNDFNRAIELDNEYAWMIANRGKTYRLMERYEEALLNFNQAIELDNEYAWAITSRGETYRLMERYEEALNDFNRAIELDNESAWVIASRGETYRLMERYEEALNDFNRAIELDNESAWAIAHRGETYRLMERYEEALKDFDRAIELGLDDDWHLYLRALTHLKLTHPDLAQTDLQQAISLAQAQYEKDPTDWQNTFNLALYHLAADNQQESDRLYQSGFNAPSTWLDMAIQDLTDFLNSFPNHSHAQQLLAQLKQVLAANIP